jgi:hypothetical protein
MDPCVKLAREYKRADKALASLRPVNEAKHQAEYDRAVFLLPLTKPESLPGAGDLIQHAARLASGAVPDEMWRLLLFIGGRLKKRELLIADTITLRQTIGLMKFLAVADDESLAAQVTIGGRDAVLAPNCKDDILSMLNHALEFVKRPQLV